MRSRCKIKRQYVSGVSLVFLHTVFAVCLSLGASHYFDGHSRYPTGRKEISSNGSCSPGLHFTCGSAECISISSVCDGKLHCEDGSDEEAGICEAKERTIRAAPQLCTTPTSNYHRSYLIISPEGNVITVKPGNKVQRFYTISLKCADGYLLEDGRNVAESTCNYKGTWHPEIKDCIKICRPLEPDNVKLTCTYKRETAECKGPLLAGTVVRPAKCQPPFHEEFKPNYSYLTCKTNGAWDQVLYKCLPDCGKPARSTTLIVKGTPAVFGESPWHVAIYDVVNHSPFLLICGGTIVSPLMVITAAHCVYDEIKALKRPATNYEVVAGKITRDYYRNDSTLQKIYKVKEIHFSSDKAYLPSSSNHASDIAVLQLETPITFNSWVLPACVDWIDRPPFYPSKSKTGKLVGWGIDELGSLTGSEVLKTADLPYIDYNECKAKSVEVDFDKFCAGSVNGAGAHQGDSGGGLLFKNENDVFYLRGIVSTKDKYSNSSIATFTDLTYHIEWLHRINQQLEKEILKLKEMINKIKNPVKQNATKPTGGGGSGGNIPANNTTNSGEESLFIEAAKKGHLNLVKFFVENRTLSLSVKDQGNDTPLNWAAFNGHIDVVKYLIEKGTDVNQRGNKADTPLINAATNGHLVVVKYLLEKNAGINLKDNAEDSALHWAAWNGHIDVVKYLVEKGADLNTRGGDLSTPLVYAARAGRVDVVKYLLEKKADVNLKTNLNDTALHWAAYQGHLEIVKYLVEGKYLDPSTKGADGETPLEMAKSRGHAEVAEYLLKKKEGNS